MSSHTEESGCYDRTTKSAGLIDIVMYLCVAHHHHQLIHHVGFHDDHRCLGQLLGIDGLLGSSQGNGQMGGYEIQCRPTLTCTLASCC